MEPRSRRFVTAMLVFAGCLCPCLGATDTPKKETGFGGYPLTPAVTAMWGLIDEPPTPEEKRVTFMIYFRGVAGWHDRRWSFNSHSETEPAVIEFLSDTVALRAEYSRSRRVLTLFRVDVPVERVNVVLVDQVDLLGQEKVMELTRLDLRMPKHANPALWVLQQSAEVRNVLFPSGK